jgi:YggT family protein
MDILNDTLQTLLSLYQGVLLLRLIMQMTRADFRNPLARAVVQLTDPVILPLRRALPPMGKTDTATVVAILLMSAVKVGFTLLLFRVGVPGVVLLAHALFVDVARVVLNTYLFAIILNAILSFVTPGNYSPAQSLLASICAPVLAPVRKLIPSPSTIDLSPLWVCIAIGILLRVIH